MGNLFMLFSREIYEAIGGHEEVHEDLLEDIAFARSVRGHNGRGIIVNADGMLTVSMYDSLRSMCEGWKRIFIEVARRQPHRLVNWGIRSIAVGVLIPSVCSRAGVVEGAQFCPIRVCPRSAHPVALH